MSPDAVGLASGDYYFIQILFCYKFSPSCYKIVDDVYFL